MAFYQLRMVVEENKFEEFTESLFDLSSEIRKEAGCDGFSLYRDIKKKDVYSVIVEWKTKQAMEKHFKQKHFSVLVGAAKVLSHDFEINISETLEKGSYPLAKKKITLHPKKMKSQRRMLS